MTSVQPGRGRSGLAVALSGLLLLLGACLVVLAGPAPLSLPVPSVVLLALLVPAYVIANRTTIDVEVRGESQSIMLSQVLLAFAVLAVAPLVHVAARLVSALTMVALERQRPTKALFNLAVAAFEVGVTAWAVSQVDASGSGPQLWFALYAGLLVSEVVSSLLLSCTWALLGLPVTPRQVVQPLLLTVATTTAFTGLAVVAVSAVQTEPLSGVVVVALALVTAHAYRAHRRLRADQATTGELLALVRGLGPLQADSAQAPLVLDQVRVLVAAERLELHLCRPDGQWLHLQVGEGRAPTARLDATGPASEPAQDSATRLSAPLLAAGGITGVLTAHDRLGAVRDFEAADRRLFDAASTELATALERGRLLAELHEAATVDPLTGLPNLGATAALLDQLLVDHDEVLLAVVAVEGFREVNETLGHVTGDRLVVEVARRLRAWHPDAVVGRTGGGRFAVALGGAAAAVSPEMLGLDLRSRVEGPAYVGAVGTHVRLSVGLVSGPEHGTDAATLLRRAETATQSARHAQGGPVVWAPAYEVQGQRRLAVVSALRTALLLGEVGVAYQPQIDVRTGAVTGVEALARWTHPALGAVSPAEFVPLAIASGQGAALTSTVLRQALTASRGWQRRHPTACISVNVPADTVLDPTFVTEVAAALEATGSDGASLVLELTEDVLVADPDLAVERMQELRALGVRLAIDDFGTGYSSLVYLKRLPIDEVKIDKGFVDGVVTDATDRALISAVVAIARTRGVRVVAEGVEQPEQQDVLGSLGVDEVQGYLHARPMPAVALGSWLRRHAAPVQGQRSS